MPPKTPLPIRQLTVLNVVLPSDFKLFFMSAYALL